MDLKLGDDIYDSFRTYQTKLLREYDVLAAEFGFRVVDARQSIVSIQNDLRRQIEQFLNTSSPSVVLVPGQETDGSDLPGLDT